MSEDITQEKRKDYTSIIKDFHEKRDEIKKTIEGHNSVINTQKEKISKLEKELKNLKPVIEGCDEKFECSKCEAYSMQFLGTQPGHGERFHHYECVVCGHRDYQT